MIRSELWDSRPYLEANGFKGVPAIFIDQYTPAGYANIGTDPYGNYRLGQGHWTVIGHPRQGTRRARYQVRI
jgi:hypothetical protein